MDPLSQGLLGSVLASNFAQRKTIVIAIIVGFLAGMAADLDVFIGKADDPLLALEFHRHFTHSLFFVPFGALIISGVIWLFTGELYSFAKLYLYAFLGFLTHGFLDSATSYGTMLFWPFSKERISWDIIAIIDPLFAIPILLLVLLSLWKKSILYSRFALLYVVLYMGIAVSQHNRVLDLQQELAKSRGHKITEQKINPTIGNIILWRSVYSFGGRYYVDAIRTVPFYRDGQFGYDDKVYEGANITKLAPEEIFPDLDKNSVQYNDILRFSKFSQSFIYKLPSREDVIADLRYGHVPNDLRSLWGVEIDVEKEKYHVNYLILRNFSKRDREGFINMLKAND